MFSYHQYHGRTIGYHLNKDIYTSSAGSLPVSLLIHPEIVLHPESVISAIANAVDTDVAIQIDNATLIAKLTKPAITIGFSGMPAFLFLMILQTSVTHPDSNVKAGVANKRIKFQ